MTKLFKQLNMLFALISVSLFLCCTCFAEECGLRVTIKDVDKIPFENINVELCKVVDYDGGNYTLMPDFSEFPETGDEVSNVFTVEQAERVYQYVISHDIHGEVKATNSKGFVDYDNLDEGIYLVFERGRQKIAFQPYLVRLPVYTTSGPAYSINSEPKTVSGDTRSLLVMIYWEDNDNAANSRPESLEVTLLKNDSALRKVVLNEGCSWEHTFHLLPKSSAYTVSIPSVKNYVLSEVEEIRDGFVIVLTYEPPKVPSPGGGGGGDDDDDDPPVIPTVKPDEKPGGETEDKIPQTGFKLIPIYTMMVAGALLVIWGMADLYLGREDK